MPNLKYSGSKGIVQSTGSGQFHVSGVGIAQDVETVTINNAHGAARSFGVTKVIQTAGAQNLVVANPVTVSDAAGQQKLITISTFTGGTLTIRNQGGTDLVGAVLKAANDYALLVWTGSDWVCVAEHTTA